MSRPREGVPSPGLFPADPFPGFGPSRFRPPDDEVSGKAVRGRSAVRLKAGVRQHAPKLPGVYGMLDARGRVVYVGKAKCLRARLLSYFRENSRDPKAGRILDHTRTLVWEHTADEFGALLRELELIRRFRPRFNVQGQPGMARYVYLCLGKGPAPYAYLTREPGKKDVAVYGPLVGRGSLDGAVRRLNDWFRLRDCPKAPPIVFADQGELFPPADPRGAKCLRFEINTCLGPCAGLCGRRDYGAAVRAARAFLDGRDRTLLKALETQMTTAAAELRFEQATALRDRWQVLSRLNERLTFLRTARQRNSFVYPLAGPDGGTVWYLIHHGEVRATVRAPADASDRSRAAAALAAVFDDPSPAAGLDEKCADSVLLVAAWFRKHRDEKPMLLTPDAARVACGEDGSRKAAEPQS